MRRKKSYDIVLVFPNFRRNAMYLSLIKYLSKDLKIGILKVPIDKPEKTFNVDRLFLNSCEDFGAEMICPGQKVSTNMLIIPQWRYSSDAIGIIRSTVTESKKNICACALTWAGMHDNLFNAFDIHKIFVIDKKLFSFLLKQKNLSTKFSREIIEIALPFEKYPVLDEPPRIDYIIAMPTPFSFPWEEHKIVFLENVLSVVDAILSENPNCVIAIKKHNATESEYILNRKFSIIASFMNKCRLNFLRKLLRHNSSFSLLSTIDSLYHDLLRKVTPLDKLTAGSQLPLEIFLPFVKKGVIGGLSNTMWGALFFKKPYFNCIPDYVEQQLKDKLTLKISLGYFGVPFCKGQLTFDSTNFNKISDLARNIDLMEILKRELREK